MQITFYKDNKTSGKFEKAIPQIISDFNESEESKLELPFERKILNFMSANYGSYDILTGEQWGELYKIRESQNENNN